MRLKILNPANTLNPAYFKQSLKREDIERFKSELQKTFDHIDEKQDEEYHKNIISKLLLEVYYKDKYLVNVNKKQDLVIRNGNKINDEVAVILEFKKPTEKKDMVSKDKPNVKSLQELVFYYLRETIDKGNHKIKYLIATNIYEWFIFDELWFEKNIFNNAKLKKDYIDWKQSGHSTQHFYDFIASKYLDSMDEEVPCTYFNLKDFKEIISNDDIKDDDKLINLYKILSPEHLLKNPFANDSNSLNKDFYKELLHIVGMEETKDSNKKLIVRKELKHRDEASLLENAINKLQTNNKLVSVSNLQLLGETKDEQLFSVALELSITWLNRILFLKLLEGQLIKYHNGEKSYSFLNTDRIKDFDELDELFFEVLAVPFDKRTASVNAKFGNIPYLNSSLFEISELESKTIKISDLKDRLEIPIYNTTVLKGTNGKRISGKKNTLQYLFDFLEAYDFASDSTAKIQEQNKNIINASVLGLIFEKINGYKDGSFFTPGFITTYMCRETIRKAVVQKFNDAKGWNCTDINTLYNKIEDQNEANLIINSLKICDPAVGSGHFLVSALNEIIAIKSELEIVKDREGRRLKEYDFEVANDELIVKDKEGTLFEYNPKNKESQRIQEALFHEKQTIIENCLFGVDINPKSVLICRLRLWIELLKNAYYKNANELETLPNIDINIKCGNSLISRFALDADLKQALKKSASKWTIESYRLAVDSYRNAQSKEEKREMERLINEIKSNFRSEISLNDPKVKSLSKAHGELYALSNQVRLYERSNKEKADWTKKVEKLAAESQKLEAEIEEIKANKIYENAFEWRFEFPEVLNDNGDFVGFDVVIGNPPYGSLFTETDKMYIKNNYQFCDYQFDIYMSFFERSYNLLKDLSQLCFIVPNTWLLNLKTPNIRKLLFSSFNTHNIRAYKAPVFEEAVVDTIIVSSEKNTDIKGSMSVQIIDRNGETIENKFLKKELADNYKSYVNIYLSDFASKIDIKFSNLNKLDNVAKITQGTKPFQKGKGKPKQDDKIMLEKPFVKTFKKDDTFRPLLRGSLINKYVITWNDDYFISLGDWLAEPRFSANYDAPVKIVIRQTGSSLIATIDKRQFVARDNLYTIVSTKKEYSEYILLACLNSKLMNWYYQNIVNNEVGEALAQVKRGHLEVLPIPNCNSSLFSEIEDAIIQILKLKEADSSIDTINLEKVIDQTIYQLYDLTAEEIEIIENGVK